MNLHGTQACKQNDLEKGGSGEPLMSFTFEYWIVSAYYLRTKQNAFDFNTNW